MRATGDCAYLFDCQTARRCNESKGYRPLFIRWARGAPSFHFTFRPPIEGDGAPTRRMAWIAPDRPESFAAPGRARIAGPWVKRHPRALQRATEHLRAYALPTARTAQELFVPAGLLRASPVGEVASASPAGALPLPAFKTPHECAPRRVDRDGLSIITLQVKSRIISLMVNKEIECSSHSNRVSIRAILLHE